MKRADVNSYEAIRKPVYEAGRLGIRSQVWDGVFPGTVSRLSVQVVDTLANGDRWLRWTV